MGEYFAGKIVIGGRIPSHVVDQLAQAIAEQGVSADYGDAKLNVEDARLMLLAATNHRDTLALVDDQASFGQFDELEAFCTRHGIDFDRTSEAKYEYDGEYIKGRGRRKPVCSTATQDGKETVHAQEIRKILQGRKSPPAKLAAIAKAIGNVPELTPVQIV